MQAAAIGAVKWLQLQLRRQAQKKVKRQRMVLTHRQQALLWLASKSWLLAMC
jgi:hypothetical protein